MTAIDEARSQLQARAKTPAKPWAFPEVSSDLLLYQRVLVFDATLSNAGWVFMEAQSVGINVLDKGTIRPVTDRTGYQETLDKAAYLDRALDSPFFASYARNADHIVVEAPAVKGYRTESSLIAGLVIMLRFRDGSDFCLVSAPHVSAVLLGDHQMRSAERKPAIRRAVIRLYPGAEGHGWNEHERDALATGATFLYDEKRKTHE